MIHMLDNNIILGVFTYFSWELVSFGVFLCPLMQQISILHRLCCNDYIDVELLCVVLHSRLWYCALVIQVYLLFYYIVRCWCFCTVHLSFCFACLIISSLRSVIEKPPILGQDLAPLSGHLLTGFRLHPGPVCTVFLFSFARNISAVKYDIVKILHHYKMQIVAWSFKEIVQKFSSFSLENLYTSMTSFWFRNKI